MKKSVFKRLGIFFVILGIFLIIIQFISLTGAVIDISKDSQRKVWITLGLIFIIIGIILFSFVKEGLVRTIERTKRFEKDTKRVDPRIIERAVEKIGTGLADEKHLRSYAGGGYSIRTDKGGRVLYELTHDGRIILTDYKPSSEHN